MLMAFTTPHSETLWKGSCPYAQEVLCGLLCIGERAFPCKFMAVTGGLKSLS